MRKCKVCGFVKPFSEFTAIKGTPYYRGECKPCRAAAHRKPNPGPRGAAAHRKPNPGPRGFKGPMEIMTCTQCGVTKPLTAFVKIKQCINGYYGRCRACRAARARESAITQILKKGKR